MRIRRNTTSPGELGGGGGGGGGGVIVLVNKQTIK